MNWALIISFVISIATALILSFWVGDEDKRNINAKNP